MSGVENPNLGKKGREKMADGKRPKEKKEKNNMKIRGRYAPRMI